MPDLMSRVLMTVRLELKSNKSLRLANQSLTQALESMMKTSRRRLSTLLNSSLESSQLPALNSSRPSTSDVKSFQPSLTTSEEVSPRLLKLSLPLHGALYKSSLTNSTTLSRKETQLLLALSAKLSMNSFMMSLISALRLKLHALLSRRNSHTELMRRLPLLLRLLSLPKEMHLKLASMRLSPTWKLLLVICRLLRTLPSATQDRPSLTPSMERELPSTILSREMLPLSLMLLSTTTTPLLSLSTTSALLSKIPLLRSKLLSMLQRPENSSRSTSSTTPTTSSTSSSSLRPNLLLSPKPSVKPDVHSPRPLMSNIRSSKHSAKLREMTSMHSAKNLETTLLRPKSMLRLSLTLLSKLIMKLSTLPSQRLLDSLLADLMSRESSSRLTLPRLLLLRTLSTLTVNMLPQLLSILHTLTLPTIPSSLNSTTTSVISSRNSMPVLMELPNGPKRRLTTPWRLSALPLDTLRLDLETRDSWDRKLLPSLLIPSLLSMPRLKTSNLMLSRKRELVSKKLLPQRPRNSRRKSST